MTNDEIRSFLERFRQSWEGQDVKALVTCYADDCVVVSPIFSTVHGRAQLGVLGRSRRTEVFQTGG